MATTAILHNRDSARLIATMSTSVVALLISAVQFGQSSTGELRVSVRDSSGLPVQSHLTLVSDANDMSQELDTAADGLSVAERLPMVATGLASSGLDSRSPVEGRTEAARIPVEPRLRIGALLVAVFSIVVGIVGIVSPEYGTWVRRQYFASPETLYPAVALRLVMGLVVMLAATASRTPKTMRALGALMCLQALTATILGTDHARAVMEWETLQGNAVLRVGAAVALAAGCFMVFAFTGARPEAPARRTQPVLTDRES